MFGISCYEPTRMCVACRSRKMQRTLLRLYIKDGLVVGSLGCASSGRSFYLCSECAACEKKITKALSRFSTIKDKTKSLQIIREMAKYE